MATGVHAAGAFAKCWEPNSSALLQLGKILWQTVDKRIKYVRI